MLPLAVVAFEVLQYGRFADQVLLGLLLAGLLAILPWFVPGFVLAAAIVLVTLTVRVFLRPQQRLCPGHQSPHPSRNCTLRRGFRYCGTELIFRILAIRASRWLHWRWYSRYALDALTIPGWLVQSRGTELLDLASHSLLSDLLFAAVVSTIRAGNHRYWQSPKQVWLVAVVAHTRVRSPGRFFRIAAYFRYHTVVLLLCRQNPAPAHPGHRLFSCARSGD